MIHSIFYTAMDSERFTTPLGDAPASLDYGHREPLSPSTIDLSPHVGLCTPSSESPVDETSLFKALRELEKLNIGDLVYEPDENGRGTDITIFRCGCWRLDRSRLRNVSKNDDTNATQASKSASYR